MQKYKNNLVQQNIILLQDRIAIKEVDGGRALWILLGSDKEMECAAFANGTFCPNTAPADRVVVMFLDDVAA